MSKSPATPKLHTVKRGDVLKLKSNGQEVAVVTVYESGHRVRHLDVVDVKGKASRVRPSEVEEVPDGE